MTVKTPCVGICSTGIGDSICRGCKRYAHEVVAWNGFNDNEKQAITQRLHYLLKQVLSSKLVIVDEQLLRQEIVNHAAQMREYEDPYAQVFELIKCLQDKMDTALLREFGVELRHAYWSLPLRLLFKEIDDELYTLSQAHFERYFGHYQQVT